MVYFKCNVKGNWHSATRVVFGENLLTHPFVDKASTCVYIKVWAKPPWGQGHLLVRASTGPKTQGGLTFSSREVPFYWPVPPHRPLFCPMHPPSTCSPQLAAFLLPPPYRTHLEVGTGVNK